MGAERLKSLKRGVLAMRRMLREMETELEKEIAECVRNGRLEPDAAEVLRISEKVIGRLNDLSDKKFRYDTEGTLYLIRCKIGDGYTEENLLLVVEEMCRRWKDDPVSRLWMRPETLFGKHFEGYLQEALSRQGSVFGHDELARLAIERIQGGNENV